jgi:hypothetical protein
LVKFRRFFLASFAAFAKLILKEAIVSGLKDVAAVGEPVEQHGGQMFVVH